MGFDKRPAIAATLSVLLATGMLLILYLSTGDSPPETKDLPKPIDLGVDKKEEPDPPSPSPTGPKMQALIESARSDVDRSLSSNDLKGAWKAVQTLLDELPGHPDEKRGRDEVTRLTAEIEAHRKRVAAKEKMKAKDPTPIPEGPKWITPAVYGTGGAGQWTSQPGNLNGTCPAGEQFGPIHMGKPDWADYKVTFELRQKQGKVGLFLRGMSRGAQFPGLLDIVKVKIDPAWFYKVEAEASGEVIVVRVTRADGEVVGVKSKNPTFANGLFGFVMHPGCKCEIRSIKAQVIKRRPPKKQ